MSEAVPNQLPPGPEPEISESSQQTSADLISEKKTLADRDKDKEFEYFFFPDEKQRMLFGEAVEGVVNAVAESNNIGDSEEAVTPNVIFLDKSARPISTIFRDLWRKKFPNQPELHIGFLNFGRELVEEDQHSGKIRIGHTNDFYLNKIRNKIKSSFLRDAPVGSLITIVDEIKGTGETEILVTEFLQQIFPGLKFKYLALAQAPEQGRTYIPGQESDFALFERVAESQFINHRYVSKNPPWHAVPQISAFVEGLTGVMDEGDQYDFRHRITALPYRKHKHFSSEEREKREQLYFENKEKLDRLLQSMANLSKGILEWNPKLDPGDYGEVPKLREGVALLKEKAEKMSDLSKKEQVTSKEFYNIFRDFRSFFNKFCIEAFDQATHHENIKREIVDALGVSDVYINYDSPFSERTVLPVGGSVAEQTENILREIYRTNDLVDRFDIASVERKIDELVPQLRQEMHHIADEYWEKKQQGNNISPE